jgi:arsenite methyltransferase
MTRTLEFDDDRARDVEKTYATADVIAQRKAVLDLLDPRPGEDALDIGSGPGYLACEIAEWVGSRGSVHGVDVSDSMLAIAARRQPAAGSAAVTFRTGQATALPFPAASFDLLTATQVYEYVPDMPGALAEARRVLRPGGRLLILDTDWDSIVWHSSDPARMHRVLTAWDEHLADPHLPRRLGRLLADAGFTVTDRSVLPMFNTGYHPDTFSAGVIGIIADFVPGHGDVTASEAEAWRTDLETLGEDYFFSLNRYLFLATA